MRLFAKENDDEEDEVIQEYCSNIKLKPEISIELIGKKRFFIGLIIGIILLVPHFLSTVFINDTFFSANSAGNYESNLIPISLFVHYLLTASFICSLIILVWFFNKKWNNFNRRIKNRSIVINIIFLGYVVNFYLITILPMLFFDKTIQLYSSKFVIAIAGIGSYIVFTNSWNVIRLILRIKNWKLLNFAFIVFYATILTLIKIYL